MTGGGAVGGLGLAQLAATTDPSRGKVDLGKGPPTGPPATGGNHANLDLGLDEGCESDKRKGKTATPSLS